MAADLVSTIVLDRRDCSFGDSIVAIQKVAIRSSRLGHFLDDFADIYRVSDSQPMVTLRQAQRAEGVRLEADDGVVL